MKLRLISNNELTNTENQRFSVRGNSFEFPAHKNFVFVVSWKSPISMIIVNDKIEK